MGRSPYLKKLIFIFFLSGIFLATNVFAQSIFTKKTPFGPLDGSSKGLGWADYNNDGYPDIYITNGSEESKEVNFLFANNGDGTFTKISTGDIVNDQFTSGGCSWGDFDNDGDLDIYVVTNTGSPFDPNRQNFLYENNGDGTFTKNTTAGAPVTDTEFSAGCAWGDYNNDSHIDLFVTNGWWNKLNNSLYSNDGDGTFTKITDQDIVGEAGATFIGSSSWADFDNDGDLDIVVAGGSGKNNFLWRNDGDTVFTKLDIFDEGDTQGCSWADYDNDGDFDLFFTNYGENEESPEANFLYQNNGDGTFTKITTGDIVSDQAFSTGSAWGDIDNDGDLDLYVASVGSPDDFTSFLYMNNGNGTFTKNETSGVTDSTFVYGAGFADYNKDGFQDLATVRFGENVLYENNGNTNHWINIQCVGTSSNTAGIGAKVKVKATINSTVVWQLRDISAQTGYGSHSNLRAHFGLGDATTIDEIKVEWPSGIVQTLTNVAVDQFLTITEEPGGESISVTSPNGGENWQIGSTHDITWNSNETSGTVKIEYSTDNGSNWTTIENSTTDDGTYSWTIPNDPSTECLVRVSDTDGDPSDESDATFTISAAASMTVTAPNGGEDWEAGTTQTITWTSENTSGNVKIEYSTDNGSNWSDVIASTTDDGSHDWVIPDEPSTDCLVRVSDTDGDPTDQSDAVFTISQAPFITVTAPNGGEDWEVGSTHAITWTSNKTSGNVHIEYSTDNGSNWSDVIASTTDDGSHDWVIPDEPSATCLVRVSDTDGDPTDQSDAVFTISQAPFITVTAPNGGEDWEVGSTHAITWTSNKTSGNVHIEYSTDNGSNWSDVIASTADDGSHDWVIPDEPSATCLVRVSDTDGDPTDQSDAVFTISQAPFITVTAPNGGEDWEAGSTHAITWTSNKTSGNVHIEYSTDNGSNWSDVIASTTDDGSHDWVIPDEPSTDCLVRVSDTDGDPTDQSDAVFTISQAPFITVTAPNGGEDWEAGSTHAITWTSNKTSGNVHIEYSTDNGSNWSDVIASTADDGSHDWVIPDEPSATCLVRVSDTDGDPTDQSDAVFTISQAPFITVTAPNGGEDWEVGSTHAITWTSNKTSGNVHIEYSTDNGSNWSDVIASTTDDGSHDWVIPDEPSTDCLVRVSDTDGDPTDQSDAVFTISQAPFITVTAPNGGEDWEVGSTHAITWTSNKTSGNVHIEYSTDNGSNWSDVIASTADDGSHDWVIPDEPSTDCLVRVSDTDGDPTDQSDAVFTISQAPFITVTAPNGGEDWEVGSTHAITWTSNKTSGNVHIEYSTDNGSNWSDVIASTTDDGSHDWVIPDEPSATCLVRVSDTDGDPTDQSDAVFTISQAPFITVTAPNGGEDWEAGSTHAITWTSNKTSGNVHIEYSTDNGSNWSDVIASTADDGSHDWVIPDEPSTDCLVRVSDTDGDPTDQSDAVFTISQAPFITVTAPNGGEDWEVGSTHAITWTSNKTSGNVHIEYSTDNGSNWSDVIASTTDDGSHDWVIPDEPSTDCLVRVSDTDGDPTDQSDAVFTISQAPFITVTAPNGGEDWEVGSTHAITWTSNKTSGNVHIEYSTDNGSNWSDVIASTTDDGSHDWVIPDEPSTDCLVRVSDTDGDPTDQSDAVFTISQAPFITVTAPNGGEDWEVGSTHAITWTSNKTSGNVHIEYSTDNGSNWSDVIASTADDGSHDWVIPDEPSTDCLVRVSDTDGDPTDQSDAVFTISQIVYTLTMAANPAQGGTTNPEVGDHNYDAGTIVDISATANPGYEFQDWTGDVADPNAASTTVTMDASKTVTANFNKVGIEISDLRASVTGENLLLEWGASDGITTYNVYRDTVYDFVPDMAGGTNRIASDITDEDAGTEGIQWTDTGNGADIVGDIETNYFYKVTAVGGEEFDPSNVAGEFDYELVTTEGTDINRIVVLMNTANTRTPIATAEDLAQAIPYCTDVYWWDASGQGTVGHVKGVPFNNFAIEPGHPYTVSVSQDTVWTVAGSYSDVSFNLVTTESTDINRIGVPLAKADLTDAEQLGQDIPNCTDVYLWDAEGQGTLGHVVGVPFNNFEVRAGYPYSISITAPTTWPDYGEGSESFASMTQVEGLTLNTGNGFLGNNIPHTVYGRLIQSGDVSLNAHSLKIRAWITSRPHEVLTAEDFGIGFENNYWSLGVSNFPTKWEIGDSVMVEITHIENGLRGLALVILSDAGSDDAGEIRLSGTTSVAGVNLSELPKDFSLLQNYPNPFNPETKISYGLPKASHVTIQIYDISGRLVKTLANGTMDAGYHQVTWNGQDNYGGLVSSGLYFCKMKSGSFQKTMKLIFAK